MISEITEEKQNVIFAMEEAETAIPPKAELTARSLAKRLIGVGSFWRPSELITALVASFDPSCNVETVDG